MENFWRRLRYYGIGFGIGLVFVFFFFQNRGCSWLPSNRVKNAILDRLIVVDEATEQELIEIGYDADMLIQVLNDGDVQFEESRRSEESKAYSIEKDGVNFIFTLPQESFVCQVFTKGDPKTINTATSGVAKVYHWPMDTTLVKSDLNPEVLCQRNYLGYKKDVDLQHDLEEGLWIDFGKSKLDVLPKPEHYMFYIHKGDTIGFESNWYKSKINITTFDIKAETNCD